MLRKYSDDPTISSTLGTTPGVRFNGKIVDKDEDTRVVVLQVQVPGVNEYIRAETKMTAKRFKSVHLFDSITGSGSVVRAFDAKRGREVVTVKPKIYVVRDERGARL